MEAVKSKRHFFSFYVSIIFVFIFSNGIGLFLIGLFIKLSNTDKKQKAILLLLLGLICIWLAFYTIYRYYKNAPSITISQNYIKIGKKRYINDIVNITLTGKFSFPYIKTFMMEGTAIEFRDLRYEVFFDSMYSNSAELKASLHNLLARDGNIVEPVKKIDSNLLYSEHFYLYKGNFFLSSRGISAITLIGGGIVLLIASKNNATAIFAFVIVVFFYLIHSHALHYFGINEKYLVIKNYLFLWKKKGYRLTDIKEIVFESNGKAPNTLKLIFNDYSSKSYHAGTLNDSDWNELQEEFEKLNIKVRNEI